MAYKKYTPKKSATKANNEYRISKLERKVGNLKPELKHRAFDINEIALINNSIAFEEISEINSGDGGAGRDGNKIKLTRIDVSLTCDNLVDIFLASPKATSAEPDPSYFIGTAHYNRSLNPDEWHVYRHVTTHVSPQQNVKWRVSFPRGKVLEYSASGGGSIKNGPIFLLIANYSGASCNCAGTVRVWYTDV
jgi:hypothetical protein